MALRAVVFDFDGVIANTEPLHLRAAQRVLQAAGLALDERAYYERYLGFDDEGLFRAVAADSGATIAADDLARLIAKKSAVLQSFIDDGSVLFAGVRDCVTRCASAVPLAIASGALGHEIDLILRRTDLRSAFRVIVGAEDTTHGKPAPDPYLRAVSRLGEIAPGLLARDCVAVEDSNWGILSAKAAGLRCVAVTHTYPAEALEGQDLTTSGLDALTLEQLESLCHE